MLYQQLLEGRNQRFEHRRIRGWGSDEEKEEEDMESVSGKTVF